MSNSSSSTNSTGLAFRTLAALGVLAFLSPEHGIAHKFVRPRSELVAMLAMHIHGPGLIEN
jgi:hypothetical protein